jgi:putative transposase
MQFHMDGTIRQEQVIAFVRHLLRHLSGKIIVVWDHLGAHQGHALRQWLARCRRVHVEYLPGYAPELNPNEYGWAYLKSNPLANYCPSDVTQLYARVLAAAESTANQQSLLRSFVHATGLPIRLRY